MFVLRAATTRCSSSAPRPPDVRPPRRVADIFVLCLLISSVVVKYCYPVHCRTRHGCVKKTAHLLLLYTSEQRTLLERPSREHTAIEISLVYQARNIKWSGNFSEGALCENSQSLWHTHETQDHCALPNATTLYGFPIRTMCSATVSNVTSANRILDGNIKWSTPFGLWKCDSPAFNTAISQFSSCFSEIWLRLIDEENVLDYFFSWYLLNLDKLRRWLIWRTAVYCIFFVFFEPRTVTLSHSKRSGPLYIPRQECDLQKSHFWGPTLHSLNGIAVKSCGIWEGAMLVLGPCVSWVPERPHHFIFLTWYRKWFITQLEVSKMRKVEKTNR